MNQTRRHFTAQEKVDALKRHLLEATPISNLCDQLGIAPNLFYRWQKDLFEGAHTVFDNGFDASISPPGRSPKLATTERLRCTISCGGATATNRLLVASPHWSTRTS